MNHDVTTPPSRWRSLAGSRRARYAASAAAACAAVAIAVAGLGSHSVPPASAATGPSVQALNSLALYGYPEGNDAYGQTGVLVGLSANKGVAVDAAGNVDASTALGSVVGQLDNPAKWQTTSVGLGNVMPPLSAATWTEQYSAANYSVSDTTVNGQAAVHFTADSVEPSGSEYPNLYYHLANPQVLSGGTMTMMASSATGTTVSMRYRPSSQSADGILTTDPVKLSATPTAITLPIPARPAGIPVTGNQTIFPIMFTTAQANVDVTFWDLSIVPNVSAVSGATKLVAGNFSTQGSALIGYSGDGGPATSAQLNAPGGIAFGPSGELYIADTQNNRIRKVAPDGTITTIAGTGRAGYSGDGGPATTARLDNPEDVAADAAGNVFIADTDSNVIREVTAAGTIRTVAGTGSAGFSGDGGPATSARLTMPEGIALDSAGDLFIADSGNNRVREVTPDGTIKTIAGNGTAGPASSGELNVPYGLAVDGAGNIYIAEYAGNQVDELSADGTLAAVAGNGTAGDVSGAGTTSAELHQPTALAIDAADGILYVASYHDVDEITGLVAPSPASASASPDAS